MSQQRSALDCIRSSSGSIVRALRLTLPARIMVQHVEKNLSALADEAGTLRNLTKHAIHNRCTKCCYHCVSKIQFNTSSDRNPTAL